MGALILVGIGVVIGAAIGGAIALALVAPSPRDHEDENPFW